ncbi:hypothetical protein EH223_01560 [candidate division KSB1 bacterium]|nr:hypothetical protein [candidate division KSB1 bacterium]RQW06885.1 MAG: hypothetical protein EH223_01560 [candidate division KSB1 bacterium]
MDETSKKIDLLVASDWQYDNDFVQLMAKEAEKAHLTVLVVNHDKLDDTIKLVEKNSLDVLVLFDRASDTTEDFFRLQRLLAKRAHVIEPLDKMRWASDKATMHLEFIANGLQTPYTIIIDSFDNNNDIWLSTDELAHLGRPFIIKPANTTGGGLGVVDGAESLHDVLVARRQFKSDKYLLQEKVIPLHIENRRFWFRGFYTFGLVQCAWWNDVTQIYKILDPAEVEQYSLQSLYSITEKISAICGLNFFSTEICLSRSNSFVVVDYVNEACDMRLQSKHVDGVPDEIVANIAEHLCAQVAAIKKQHETGVRVLPEKA